MSNIQFSALDNVKVTCKTISTKVSIRITIRKYTFPLIYVDLEYETIISIWEFELMIVLN